MSAGHSGIACYGVKIQMHGGRRVDDLIRWLATTTSGMDYVEWGSLWYGGSGGFIVCQSGSAVSVEEDDSGCRLLPAIDPDRDFKTRLEEEIKNGAPFSLVSEVGWWVGVHTW